MLALVEVRSLATTVAIFHKSVRVASHLCSHGSGRTITNPEHRSKSHQAHLEWAPLRMVNWARSIRSNTARLFERILEEKPHSEMGIELVWASFGWPMNTRQCGWNLRRSSPCRQAPAATA